MPARSDKRSRKEKLSAWRAQQRKTARDALPVAANQMRVMFGSLKESLATETCDHSLKLVQTWAESMDLPFAALEAWCRNNGGYCDCEVLANCQQAFEDAMHDVDWEK